MNFEVKQQVPLAALDSALHHAREPTLDLLAKIIGGAGSRPSLLAKAKTFNRLIEFAKIGAWTEAAFALIALELPLWRVRRLAYEDGEWLCSLSYQLNLPIEIDDCAEATHEVLPLAMLRAFVEACGRRHVMRGVRIYRSAYSAMAGANQAIVVVNGDFELDTSGMRRSALRL